jgi:phospholipid/cholesterol/gamma-HCH transport system ATP-binding protein
MTAYTEVQKPEVPPQPDKPSSGRVGTAGLVDELAKPLKQSLAEGESQNPSAPAVQFRNVHFFFDDEKVLDGVSFTVMRGEIKIILSGSGGGKSTILNLILGLLKPDTGQILIDDEDITDYDESQLKPVRDRIGMVFQEGGLFDSLSVYDNVAYRLHEEDVPEEDVEREVRLLLRFVNLENEMDKLPNELSGGMQKRVGIARALVGNPKIVLFDEPTAALDPPTAATISELIIRLRDLENVASILVTHEMDTVKYITTEYAVISEKGEVIVEDEGDKFCLSNTKILMLREGRVIFSGTNEEFVQSEDPYIQKFICGTEMEPSQVTKGRP